MTPEELARIRAGSDASTLEPWWKDRRIQRLLDHIDAMAAREAKLRALHRKLHHESGLGPMCAECVDDWPCNTIRILDGET